MTTPCREVRLCDDNGDDAFARAAPLLVRAMRLIAHTHAVAAATRTACQQYELCLATHGDVCGCNDDDDNNDNNDQGASASQQPPSHRHRARGDDEDEVAALREMAAPYVADMSASFASWWQCGRGATCKARDDTSSRAASARAVAGAECACVYVRGLVLPAGVQLRGRSLTQHAMTRASVFAAQLQQLSTLVSSGVLFTACQPRLRVLQSRYALYRAYNSVVEDAAPAPHASTAMTAPDSGSGGVAQAPHVDVRRVETCMSADTLVRALNELRRAHGDDVDVDDDGEHDGTHNDDDDKQHDGDGSGCRSRRRRRCGDAAVARAVSRFFGSDVPASAHVLTAESLHVRPNYAAEASQRADLDCSIEACTVGASPSTRRGDRALRASPPPRAQQPPPQQPHRHARELLCHVLHPHHRDDGDDGMLLGRIVVSTLQRLARPPSSSSSSAHTRTATDGSAAATAASATAATAAAAGSVGGGAATATDGDVGRCVELELTVTGRSDDEVAAWARWCVRSGLLDACPTVQLTIRVTQGSACGGSGGCGGDDAAHTRVGVARDVYTPPWQHNDAMTAAAAEAAPQQQQQQQQQHQQQQQTTTTDAQPLTLSLLLRRVFAAIWAAWRAPDAHADVARMLRHVTGFAVHCSSAADVQDMPCMTKRGGDGDDDNDNDEDDVVDMPLPVADAYFAYHVWRNVQLLNCATAARARLSCPRRRCCSTHASSSALLACSGGACDVLRFRVHGGEHSRGRYTQSLLGLLLADEMANPASAFEWAPLGYLYYLVQRAVVLSPSLNRVTTPTLRALLDTAVPFAVQTGLHASLASVDALLYSATDDAAHEDMHDVARSHRLCSTDVCELCLHAVEARGRLSLRARTRLYGGPWWRRARARDNVAARTHVHTLRLQHREAALVHELQLLHRVQRDRAHAPPHHAGAGVGRDAASARAPHDADKTSGRSDDADKDGEGAAALSFAHLCVFYHGGEVARAVQAATASSASSATAQKRIVHDDDNNTNSDDGSSSSDGYGGGGVGVSSCDRHTRETALRFPRIVIAGPRVSEPAATAKALVRVLRRRRYYGSFASRQSGDVDHASGHHDDDDVRAHAGDGVTHATSTTSATRVCDDASLTFVDGVFDMPPVTPATATSSSSSTTTASSSQSSWRGEASTRAVAAPAPQHAALPSWRDYQADVRWLRNLAHDTALQQFAAKRLHMLECKYNLHTALTNDDEGAFAFVDDTTTAAAAAVAAAAHTRNCSSDDNNNDKGGSGSGSSRVVVTTTIPPRHVKGDLHNIVKVDVHCHMAGGMTARALLSFMKHKLQHHPDDTVARDAATGRAVTLAELFDQLLASQQQQQQQQQQQRPAVVDGGSSRETRASVSPRGRPAVQRALDAMTIGLLDVQAGTRTFNRFDEFNNRYSPMRAAALRSLFLKTDNAMHGRYFAELARGTFAAQQAEGNTYSEYRLSVYGRHPGEWHALSRWFVQHALAHPTNRWLVQVPRLYALHKRRGDVRSFADMLHNLFAPLWAASREPARHADVHAFLSHVSGFDSVDDESDREAEHVDVAVPPQAWTRDDNPPYAYYMYHMWANVVTLNRYRAARGLCTFAFRPHGGESGDADHMADVLLLADGVGHGIQLRQRPVLQYLYYLAQVPLAVVPLSNNALFCRYRDNPLPSFFRRGLFVALGTDGALMFHHTEQPLIEEYGVAQHYYALSGADVCELAHNSVRMSGFGDAQKLAWLDALHALRSVAGNAVDKTHVPITRAAFRYEVYMEEAAYLAARAATSVDDVRAMCTPFEEEIYALEHVGLSRAEVVRRRVYKLPLHTAAPTTTTTTKAPVTSYASSRL